MSKWETARGWALARMLIVSTWNLGECFFGRFYSSEDLPCLQCMLFFAGLKLSTIVVICWFGLVWIPEMPWKKEDCYFRVPRFESQTTGPQTTNLLLVEIVVMFFLILLGSPIWPVDVSNSCPLLVECRRAKKTSTFATLTGGNIHPKLMTPWAMKKQLVGYLKVKIDGTDTKR